MVIPITSFVLLGKRLAQLSRKMGAITVPDMLGRRFNHPAVGLLASLLIIFFMTFLMVAQFKAGAIVMKLAWPGAGALALAEDTTDGIDTAYYIGLVVFTMTVVGYTLIGGFLASVWTDLFQSVLMLIGVMLLFVLIVPLAPGTSMQQITLDAVANTSPAFASAPGYIAGAESELHQFLPLGLAFSFFWIWVFVGVGTPASMVRVMACRDTATIRRSVVLLAVYNMLIYIPLLVICIAARSLMPSLASSDEVIPRVALWATRDLFAGSFLSGLILAAPFGAVMATVSMYLIVIASAVVRDVYLQFLNPQASQSEMRRVSQGVMVVFGAIAVVANIWPVRYLQAINIFSASCMAAAFLVPAIMTAYWRRATAAGAIAAMLAGAGTMLALFSTGWMMAWLGIDQQYGLVTSFRPYFLWGIDPFVWSMLASVTAGVSVSLATNPPENALLSDFFDSPASA
jgi:SSS family solute:Na+ symporter/sodium/pantothenate symporter